MKLTPLHAWYYSSIISLSILTPFLISYVSQYYPDSPSAKIPGAYLPLLYLLVICIMVAVRMAMSTLWVSTSKPSRWWFAAWVIALVAYLFFSGTVTNAVICLIVALLAGNVTFFGPGRRNTIITLALISSIASVLIFDNLSVRADNLMFMFTMLYVGTCQLNKDIEGRLMHQQSWGPITVSLLSFGLKKLLAVGFGFKKKP